MKKIRLSITPAMAVLLFCTVATTPLSRLAAGLLAAALHELGHVAAAAALGIELRSLRLDVLGARLHTTGRLHSYAAETVLCAAGPLANFLTFALSLPFAKTVPFALSLCTASLSLGFLNLIPIEGFDGGRMLSALLMRLLPPAPAEALAKSVCFASVFFLWLISVWLLLRTGTSLSAFVFSCCLFGLMFVR